MSEDLSLLQMEISKGNVNAYERVFHLHYNSLLRLGTSLLKNKSQAEEIVSDVFLHIWTNRTSIQEIQNLKTYLFIAVKNNCLKFLSRSKQVIDIDDCEPIACFATPETRLLSEELYQTIQNAIQKLPPRCKMCFQLVKEEGLSYKETAQVLGISVKTVDAQLVTAIKKISEILF